MKIAALIARILLGLMFTVFGLNAFFNFIPAQLPPGVAGQYSSIMMSTHYFMYVGAVMVLGGLCLLFNSFVPLGLVFLGPILVNILIFHLTMAPASIGMGVLAVVLWGIVFWVHRAAFAPLFQAKA